MKKKNREIEIGSKEYPYCNNRFCEDKECLRRWEYAPRNKLFWRDEYKNKDGKCKEKI
jgi:hypothetical protein